MPRPAPEPRRSKSLTPFYVILGLVLLAGIALLATQLRPGAHAAANQGVAVQLSPEQLQRVQGISLGRADAPITIYEFADFQCPHCAQFAAFIEPLIRENLVNTGKARYVFYEFPLGGAFKWSWVAARAGRCANEQGKFWDYHGMVFGRQADWVYERDPITKFTEYAQSAGMDASKFERCVRSQQYQREVSESSQLGQTLGVQGTPTLFVNGRRIEPLPSSYAEFEQQVRRIAPDAFAGTAPAAPAAADTGGKVTGQSPAQ
ncbi:MAG TPA: DsbA family protein [Longimicrobiaceae bacterium]|nr:DsbA family protein [Longimicrobiaceae bacterium]